MCSSETRRRSQVKVVSEKTRALYLKLRENEPAPPERLFHYTNSQGLLGIVTGQKLWASHADFLNDSSEAGYAFDVLKDSLKEIVRGLAGAGNAARWFSGVWDYKDGLSSSVLGGTGASSWVTWLSPLTVGAREIGRAHV